MAPLLSSEAMPGVRFTPSPCSDMTLQLFLVFYRGQQRHAGSAHLCDLADNGFKSQLVGWVGGLH